MEKKLTLPRAVREQAERAEAAHQALLANTAPQQVAAPQEPVVTPVVVVEPVTPAAPVVVTPATEPVVAPVADSWELKYRVLNGKYTAEVPRMAQELRELRGQLQAAQVSPPAPAAAPVASNAGLDAVTAQYGEDFAAAVSTVAEASVQKLRDGLTAEVEVVKTESAARARREFLTDLAGLVPTWKSVDADIGFTAYLDEFQAQTGRTRREFFNEADASNNAARVASFFAAYIRATTPARPSVVTPVEPQVEPLISPDSSRASEAPPGKKLWSRAEIQQFYADSRAQGGSKPYGRYTAAEYARIDTDISVAQAEGRYIG